MTSVVLVHSWVFGWSEGSKRVGKVVVVREEWQLQACRIYHCARRIGRGGLLDRGACCRGGAPQLQEAVVGQVVGHVRDLLGVGHLSTPDRGSTP
jgi:hypothetical protein